jgi:trans-aconitate methyltransferase
MSEWRLFDKGTVPEFTTPGWYEPRDAAPHIDEAGHADRLRMSADLASDAIGRYRPQWLHDVGCGDGGFLTLLRDRGRTLPMYGADLAAANVTAAQARGHAAVLADWVTDPPADMTEMVTALEVLEHLLDPHDFLTRLARSAKWLVASSPYTETPDSHYEYHAWAWDLSGYRDMLSRAGWDVVQQNTVWISQVIVARSFVTT